MIKHPSHINFLFGFDKSEMAAFIRQKMPLLYQIMRFGLVGVVASAVHFSIVVMLVQQLSLAPLIANIIGFSIGFQVSYSGHRHWTFRGTTAEHSVAYTRLLILQINNFILNETFYYILLNMHIPYQIALIIVLSIMPILTFTISKLWIFR